MHKKLPINFIHILLFTLIAFVGILHANPLPTASINWAGYIAASNVSNAQNGTVTMVNGSWTVQTADQTTNPYGYSSQWIGIDGATNQDLIQTGTESDLADNIYNSSYFAWWELLPLPATLIPGFSVSPGDNMYASIKLVNATAHLWSITIKDKTKKEKFTTTVTYNASEASAEWIDERPYVGFFPPLADFHEGFYGSKYTGVRNTDFAKIAGTSVNLNDLNTVAISLYNVSSPQLQAVPSPITKDGSFAVELLPEIGISKSSLGIDKGNTEVLTANIYGGVGKLKYQWYQEMPGSSNFTLISGAKTGNYTFNTGILGNWNFIAKVTDSLENNASAKAQVGVNSPPKFNSQTTSPNTVIDAGQNATFTSGIPANGTAPYTYYWYEKAPGASNFTSTNSKLLAFYSASESPYYYYNSPYANPCVNTPSNIYCPISPLYINSKLASIYGKLSNGNVSDWSFTNSYPTNTTYDSCVQDYSYAYCIGGLNFFVGISSSSVYAPLSNSSGIGTWSNTTSYPTSIYEQNCVEYDNYIYCLGGINGQALSTSSSYYAQLSTKGIGTWTATTSYPIAAYASSCSVSNGYIYCIGGASNFYPYYPMTNESYYAQLSPSGVGPWKQTTSYPSPIENENCNTDGNYIYCNSGINENSYENASYYAPVSANGIGTWTASGAYPIPAVFKSCVDTSGYAYCEEACNVFSVGSGPNFFYYICGNAPYVPTYAEKVLPAQYTFHSSSLTTTGTYKFELWAKDSGGSAAQNSIPASVTVNPDPSLLLNFSSPSVTIGSNEIIEVTAVGGTPPYTSHISILNHLGTLVYTKAYSLVNTTSYSTVFTPASNAVIGAYTVDVNVTDSAQPPVTGSNSGAFTVIAPVSVSLLPSSETVTTKQTANMTYSISGGVMPYGAISVSINNTKGVSIPIVEVASASAGNILINFTKAGTYKIYFNVTDQIGGGVVQSASAHSVITVKK